MRHPPPLAAAVLLLCAACSSAQDAAAPSAPQAGCLPGNGGFLRARLRGAIDADLDWHDADMTCEGSPRPDGKGLRLTIAGPLKDTGRMLRFVFGVDAVAQGGDGRNLATNLTLIVEGADALYATRGEDKCTLDELLRSPAGGQLPARQRVAARGFCTGPAASIDGTQRVLVERFDFATQFTTEDLH